MKSSLRIGALIAFLAIGWAMNLGNFLGNLFATTISKTFYIPNESSMRTFHPTVMNDGSGDWWLYGEDGQNYYAISDDDHYKYLYIPKQNLTQNMDPLNKETWGDAAKTNSIK